MSDVAERVLKAIRSAIRKEELLLPTLPEVALRVRDVAEDPDSDINKLCGILQTDPALSARVIKIVNSPLLRTGQTINDLRTAVSRLGMTYTANLVMGLAMEQMFQSTSAIVDTKLRQTWSNSTEVASIASVICRHCTDLKPDQAMLSGLIHNIGTLPLLAFAEQHEALQKPKVLDALIKKIAPTLGSQLLEYWQFPDEISCIPEQHLIFDRQPPAADYADIVTVANLQACYGSDQPLGQVDWKEVSAFTRLGLDPEMESFEGTDISADLEAASGALS